MTRPFDDLSKRIQLLLGELEPSGVLVEPEFLKRLLRVGEVKVCLETLVDNLCEDGIALREDHFRELRAVVAAAGLDAQYDESLRRLVGVRGFVPADAN